MYGRQHTSGEAELEHILRRVDRAVHQAMPEMEEQYTPSPIIGNICRSASAFANQLRREMQRARTAPEQWRRKFVIEHVQRRGAVWINRISNQMLPNLGRFHPRDLDRLNGCLARVEAAIGKETIPLRRLRGAIAQRLGMV